MALEVSFTEIQAATREAAEDARLVFANERLVALLVPASQGWFLQVGFGPCEKEGMIFETLAAAADWVRECFGRRPPIMMLR